MSAGSHVDRPAESRRNRLVLCVLAVGALDFGLEQFVAGPMLPAVQRAEGVPLTTAAWLVTGFLLAAVAAVPIVGRLGDMYGRRRLLLVSVAAFGLGSVVCALAGSMTWLIAGRVVQGLGAGLGPLAVGIAREQAPRGRAPVWIGLLVATTGAGAAAGLLIGGLLVEHVSVAAVFWLLAGVALLLFLAVLLVLDETPVRPSARPDWVGGLALTAALLAGLLAITHGNAWGWSSTRVVALFAFAVAALAGFVVVERAAAAPLVDVRRMEARPVWSANLVAFAMGFSLFIAGVVIPQIAALPEESGYGFGMSYAEIGLLLTPSALAIVAGGWLSGLLVQRSGPRALVAVGAAVGAGSYAVLATAHERPLTVMAANAALGFGIGLVFAAIANLVVGAVDPESTSAFVATTAVTRSIGAALGGQVAAAVVVAAGIASSGFPDEDGYTSAFLLGLAATAVALVATAAIPRTAALDVGGAGRHERRARSPG